MNSSPNQACSEFAKLGMQIEPILQFGPLLRGAVSRVCLQRLTTAWLATFLPVHSQVVTRTTNLVAGVKILVRKFPSGTYFAQCPATQLQACCSSHLGAVQE